MSAPINKEDDLRQFYTEVVQEIIEETLERFIASQQEYDAKETEQGQD